MEDPMGANAGAGPEVQSGRLSSRATRAKLPLRSQRGTVEPNIPARRSTARTTRTAAAAASVPASPAARPKQTHKTVRKREKPLPLVNGKLPAFGSPEVVGMTMGDIIRLAETAEKEKAKLTEGNKKKKKNETAASREPPKRARPEARQLAPQVQVIDGRLVVNESSLIAPSHERDDIGEYNRVEDGQQLLNYASYLNRERSERWKEEETEQFYKALGQFGTDFNLIQRLFPGRSRRQIKNKFTKEDRANPTRIANALMHKQRDHSHYEEMVCKIRGEREDEGMDAFTDGRAADGDNDMASGLPMDDEAAAAAADEELLNSGLRYEMGSGSAGDGYFNTDPEVDPDGFEPPSYGMGHGPSDSEYNGQFGGPSEFERVGGPELGPTTQGQSVDDVGGQERDAGENVKVAAVEVPLVQETVIAEPSPRDLIMQRKAERLRMQQAKKQQAGQ